MGNEFPRVKKLAARGIYNYFLPKRRILKGHSGDNDSAEIMVEDYVEQPHLNDRVITWLDSLDSGSRRRYERIIGDFVEVGGLEGDICSNVRKFIGDVHERGIATSSLWSIFSVLCSWISFLRGLNAKERLSDVPKLLRNWEKDEETKKSAVFELEEIRKFVNEAPDDVYLVMKVALIIGYSGLLRKIELVEIEFSDVTMCDEGVVVFVHRRKQKGTRSRDSFYICDVDYVNTIEKYIALCEPEGRKGRFLRKVSQGKLSKQVIGKNMIAQYPSKIAEYLKLPNPKSYTGHCYRRTGATIMANSGCSLNQLKRCGGWASATVCEGYVDSSSASKTEAALRLAGSSSVISGGNGPAAARFGGAGGNMTCNVTVTAGDSSSVSIVIPSFRASKE